MGRPGFAAHGDESFLDRKIARQTTAMVMRRVRMEPFVLLGWRVGVGGGRGAVLSEYGSGKW